MAQQVTEFRYSAASRQRSILWLAVEGVLLLGLIFVLVARWGDLTIGTRILGVLLLLALLFNMQTQFARLQYRCRIWTDRLQISGRSTDKTILWTEIVQIRRVAVPQLGGKPRWAVMLIVRGAHGRTSRVYLFDHQLERADEALKLLVQYTPNAQHVNVVE